METPEKIFLEEQSGSNGFICLDYDNDCEAVYIRSDIAEKMAKDQYEKGIVDGRKLYSNFVD